MGGTIILLALFAQKYIFKQRNLYSTVQKGHKTKAQLSNGHYSFKPQKSFSKAGRKRSVLGADQFMKSTPGWDLTSTGESFIQMFRSQRSQQQLYILYVHVQKLLIQMYIVFIEFANNFPGSLLLAGILT